MDDWEVRQIVLLSSNEEDEFRRIFSVPIEKAPRGKELATWMKRPAELLLSVGFHRILKKDVIDAAPLIINIHPSLLPKYRGWTLNWAIINGDSEHGLTAHIVDEGVDTGPILCNYSFPLTVFDTYASLKRKLIDAHDVFVPELLEKLSKGSLTATDQEDVRKPDLPKRTPKDSEIDPAKSISELYNVIRSSDPELFPAHFYVDGHQVNIKLWRPVKPDDEFDLL